MTYGTYFRLAPRIEVLRGYGGNESSALTRSAQPKTGEAIQSGMVISLDINNQWVKGCANGKVPFIAFEDQTDTDVVSSGVLLGLSCIGQYEIQTGYFDNTQTYVEGSPLKASTATPGSLTLGVAGTDTLVGYASGGGRQDVTLINSEAKPTGTPPKLYMLQFVPKWVMHGA